MKPVTVAIIGLGSRGLMTYAPCQNEFPDKLKIVAVADIVPEKVERAKSLYGVSEEMCFGSGEELLAQPKLADAAFICTMDKLHYGHAKAALEKGYDLLLEKPISPDEDECRELVDVAKRLGRKVCVCHVLRYTPFYGELKRLLDEGAVGEVVSVQHIENVLYWHQAHSFVRGNWRNSIESSPMILQKCCHDADLLVWLLGRRASKVQSFGGLYEFRSDRAPAGSAERCADCKVRESCDFDAYKIYLTNDSTGFLKGHTGWPCNVLVPTEPTEESLRKAIAEGPYGRCVWHCDNDVCDHQVVNIEFEGGATAQLTMCAFTKRGGRDTVILGTKGQIIANMEENLIHVMPFDGDNYDIDITKLASDLRGHAGGDTRLVEEFIDIVGGAAPTVRTTALADSTESHYIAFAAEKSRVEGGRTVDMKEFRD